MQRSLKILALAAALATCSGTLAAQDVSLGWNPRTGDVWMDTWLGDVNRYGNRYRDPFIDEMVRYHGAPRSLVEELLGRRRWTPGDVYFACTIASIIGRPCRYVAETWERDRGQGWGVVAKRLGIKPGSPEFHRLKRGFVPTYDRWARPITLDAELARAFPGHGKGKGGPGKAAAPAARGKADHGGSPKGGAHGSAGKSGGHGNKGGGKGRGKG
jgi:hypothetical protein